MGTKLKKAITRKAAAVVKKKTATKEEKTKSLKPAFLNKFEGNPIIAPQSHNKWESKATFNPAAIYEEGKIHILYRAIGDNDISVLGYASSIDGLHIDERLAEPAYIPEEIFAARKLGEPATPALSYVSGGGWWGGCEDPRLTRIDDRVYLFYVAFDGANPPRVAITSIDVKDFVAKRWKWGKAKIISPPHVVDKNACLLPEKIGGKYVIFHRIFPDILIDFVDDLDFKEGEYLEGRYKISPSPVNWDSRKVGAGAPPIKTKDGWLLIYQGIGEGDPGRYKMGAMLLDLKDPTKVLYRAKDPVLEPDEWYENEGWKYGVVYPCGAVVVKDTLFVYYGGADAVVCVATAPLDEFIEKLKRNGTPKLTPMKKSHARH